MRLAGGLLARAAMLAALSALLAAEGTGAAPSLRVERFSPEGTVKGVRQVTARFSRAMVALGDPRLPDPFDVECSEPGRGRWVDPRNWAYEFARDLPAGVACRFVLPPDLASLDGAKLSGRREFRFDTGGPAIRISLPYEGQRAIDENQVFLLATDGPADPASVSAHARCVVAGLGEAIEVDVLTGDARAAVLAERRRIGWQYFSLLWKSGEESLAAVSDERLARAEEELVVLRCRRELPPSAQVSLVWGAGIATPSGIATSQDQVLAFRTRPEFTATFSCHRVRADAACLGLEPLSLRFSAPVPRDAAAGVRLVGADGRVWPAQPDASPTTQRVSFPGPFPESARFRVEVPEGLRDDAGRALANAARFPLEVATDELPPLAKFSGEFGILESREGGVLPVTLRNLEPEVEARLRGPSAGPPGAPPAIGARSLRLFDDDAEIVRWLERVERAMRRRRERDAHGEPREATGSTSVFEGLAPDAPGMRSFRVPKPEGARDFEVVGIPLETPGFYVVELASPRLGAALLGDDRTRYVATAALVTNLAVHLKWGRESSLVWVTTLDGAEPVAGAQLRISDYCSGKRLFEGETDAHGLARVADGILPEPVDWNSCAPNAPAPVFVSARADGELGFTTSFWNGGVKPRDFGLPTARWTGPWLAHAVLDRALFRAGETVSMKHFVRQQSSAGFSAPASIGPARLLIAHEGSGQEYPQDLDFDASAVALSEWTIPRDAKLGTYRLSLEAELGGEKRTLDMGSFRVEEFRVPTMKAVVQPPAEPLVGASEANVDVFVGYLSGGAAAGAPVKLRTLVRPRRASFAGYPDYAFGGDDVVEGLAEEGIFDFDHHRRQSQARPAQVFPLVLDAAGAARVRVPDLPRVETPHEVVAELEYQDANGERLSASSRFELWPALVQLGIRGEGWVSSAEQTRFRIVALDLRGKPVADLPVEVDLFQRTTWSHRRRLVGGFYAYESQVETKKIPPRCTGRTDPSGVLACEVAPGVSGRIALRARARDDAGNASLASSEVWVAGADDWWFGGDASDRIDLLPERAHYEPGEMARLQVRMPFRSARALVTVEREGVLDGFVTEISGGEPVVEVPIAGRFAPNVYVSVLAVRGRRGAVASRLADLARWSGVVGGADGGTPTALVDLSRPSWRLGVAKLDVGWSANRLDVEVVPDAESFRVRQTAGVRLAVRRADGGVLPPGAEVAVAAVDEGLLELLPNDSWKLLERMMARRGIEVFTATAQMQVVGKRHYGRKAVPQGGGGGRAGARELFDTLLLWRGRVRLDARGEARVEVPLNDTLGAFRIVAVASGDAGLFGTGEATIRTTQELMLHAGLPPLVREGDRFAAVFTLRNASDRTLAIVARGRLHAEPGAGADEAPTRELDPISLELAPGAATPLEWLATAPAGAARLVWEVQASAPGGVSDGLRAQQAVIPAIPVRVLQATLLQLDGPQELPVARPADAIAGRGGVEVGLRARLGDGLDAVREYMSLYPYTCLEQKASRAVALRDEARWQQVMRELPAYLDGDGLAKYFASDWLPGEDVLTAYLLSIANEADWAIPAASLERMKNGLAGFIEGRIVRGSALPTADLAIRKLAAIDALSRHGASKVEWLATIPIDPNLWPTSALLDWLGILARVEKVPDREAQRAEALRILRARLDLHGTRLAFSTERDDALWWLMLSADVNAVRLIPTLLGDPDWRGELPRIAQGALARQQRGRWNTTTANAWGVLAFEKFSDAFEKEPVRGRSEATLGSARQSLAWNEGAGAGALEFPWPPRRETLHIAHSGRGRPWAFVTARAAIPLVEPLTAGFRIQRRVSPVAQQTPGRLSSGDVVRVSLEIDAQSDMTWIVVDDPIPAGSRILGGGLGRDSELLAAGEDWEGRAWPAFEERRFEGFRAYYRFVPKGRFTVEYTLRLGSPGRFALPPTRVEALYAPEMFGELPNEAVVVEAAP